MKMTVTLILGICAVLVASDKPSGDPEGMSCRDVVIVRYSNGPKSEDFAKHVADHLAFLSKGLQSGKILFAGPLRDGPGGYTVYALTDKKEVDKWVKRDPLIVNKVCIYESSRWMMCQAAPTDGK